MGWDENHLSSLSLAAALVGGNIAAATTGSKATTSLSLETATTLATGTITTTATSRATTSTVATVGVTTGATLLEEDLFTADLVRVGGDGSSIAGGLSELDESAVL